MSETPQAILATWLEAGNPTHLPRIREAIRAVLARLSAVENAGHEETCGGEDPDGHMCACGWLQRKSAHGYILSIEAERDTLRAEIARRDHVAHVNASWRPDR